MFEMQFCYCRILSELFYIRKISEVYADIDIEIITDSNGFNLLKTLVNSKTKCRQETKLHWKLKSTFS